MKNTAILFVLIASLALQGYAKPIRAEVAHDPAQKTVTMSDAEKDLVLRLNYDGKCVLDRVVVRGTETIAPATGACSGFQVAGQWITTREISTPRVSVEGNAVTVADIVLKGSGVEANETWTFTVEQDGIVWRIARKYLIGGTLDDDYFPGWDFNEQSWSGALLGTGGVAWFKLFDTPAATYGIHTGPVTFWNRDRDCCLRIVPVAGEGTHLAVRFSRHPQGVISCNHSASGRELSPKHGLYRFLRDRRDVWAPFSISPGETAVEFRLSAPKYSAVYDRGELRGLDGGAVREICNTIGRLGAIDEKIHGSNGWYSGYAVQQEQWIAQLGLAIDDPEYFRAYADTLDYQRDHAIGPDGRVKPRWWYAPGDDMPGTYDPLGFYECQWGYMLDSQPCFVTNVAEEFDFNGDVEWVRWHKTTCEKALDYLLRRDSNGNGLVEMMTDSHAEKKGSDWADVVWASFENGLVNAQLYNSLLLWAEVEDILNDSAMASKYRGCAEKLKASFNRSAADGGLWDEEHHCYAHWRDKDGSIHGANLVTPVNFMAIAYGICEDPSRRAAILDGIEDQMQREKLFMWPLCIYPYQKDEGHESVNWPFPSYENGDIFLAWGELGTRAYAQYKPEIGVRCVKNVLAQYAKDGLAFQRYLRKTQVGEGNDILSNMAGPIVGLYRNIYGVRPKWNRFYLEPHLTPELAGTKLKYLLRDQLYRIDLSVGDYAIGIGKFTIRQREPFAVDAKGDTLKYFSGERQTPSMTAVLQAGETFEVNVESWPTGGDGVRKWTESCDRAEATVRHVVSDLTPDAEWKVSRGGTEEYLRSDAEGKISFAQSGGFASPIDFEISPGREEKTQNQEKEQ